MLTLADILGFISNREYRASSSGETGIPIAGACVDSRQVRKQCLFVALPGERTDGHAYLADAHKNGATVLLISKSFYDGHWQELPDADLVIVEDTLGALQELAQGWRRKHSVKVVGITGSVGKTSTKEMVAAVLSRRFAVLKNEANLNSEIGLPLTLLNLDDSHQRAVLEMAMYALGDIALLCRLASPEIGVVTNVGPSHMGRLGSLANICRAKAELIDCLPAGGAAILNGDDELVRSMSSRTKASVILYGLGKGNDVFAEGICCQGLDRVEFDLNLGGQKTHVTLPVPGEHNVLNALAAAGVGLAEHFSLGDIVAGLEGMKVESRVRLLPGVNGSRVIDDSYNASPVSTAAALDLLSRAAGRKIAVLGDMYELGPFELEGHRQVGRQAAGVADELIAVGEKGKLIGEEALRRGLKDVTFCSSTAEAADLLRTIASSTDTILVKGSRGMRMEDIVERIKADS